MASKLTPRRFKNLCAWLSVGDLHRTKQYKLLMDFLKRARKDDPDTFDTQWHEHMRGVKLRLTTHAEVSSLEEAEAIYALLPCRTLSLTITDRPPEPGAASAAGLLASRALESVRELTLLRQQLGDEGVRALADSPKLPPLELLSLQDEPTLGWEALRALLDRLEQLGALKGLTLWDISLSRDAARELSALSVLGRLQLVRGGLDAQIVEALSDGPLLQSLDHLHLGFNPIGDAGVTALASALAPVEELCLGQTSLGVAGLQALVDAGALERVSWLMLWGNHDIGDAGAQVLAGASMPALRELDLSACSVGDAGALALLGAPWLGTLKLLNLKSSLITDALLDALLAHPGLPEQLTIKLQGCSNLSEAAIRRVERATLSCRVLVSRY